MSRVAQPLNVSTPGQRFIFKTFPIISSHLCAKNNSPKLNKSHLFQVRDIPDEPRQLVFTQSQHTAIIRQKPLEVVGLER